MSDDDPIPPDLAELARHNGAQEMFASLPLSHRREYVTWINQAKRETTRQRRIERAVKMILGGKGHL